MYNFLVSPVVHMVIPRNFSINSKELDWQCTHLIMLPPFTPIPNGVAIIRDKLPYTRSQENAMLLPTFCGIAISKLPPQNDAHSEEWEKAF